MIRHAEQEAVSSEATGKMSGEASCAFATPIRIYRGGRSGKHTASANTHDSNASFPPPVLFVNGCCLTSELWKPVIDLLGEREWLAFDRPGLTTHSAGADLRRLSLHVEILAELAEGFGRPVVCVAHSMGAIHVEALVRQRPELVAGVVLVDPSLEQRRWPALPRVGAATAATFPRNRLLAALGQRVLRWITALGTHTPERWLPQRVHAVSVRGALIEWLNYRPQANELVRLRRETSLPAVAVRVLEVPPVRPGHREIWHAAIAAKAYQLISFPTAKHLLMVDYPHAVVDAINSLAAPLRTS